MRKAYREKETKYWIFTIRTAMYRIFILLFKHPLIYIKERTILKGYQEPFCLKYYLGKAKEWYQIKNKNNERIII